MVISKGLAATAGQSLVTLNGKTFCTQMLYLGKRMVDGSTGSSQREPALPSMPQFGSKNFLYFTGFA
jgi:hypothetical protein